MRPSRRALVIALPAIVSFIAACAAVRAVCTHETPGQSRRAEDMISLDVQCERSDYVPGGDVRLLLRVKNAGAGAVHIADPQDPANAELEYAVVGPSWPKGKTFNLRAQAAESGASTSREEPFAPANIDAGASFETSVSLSSLADLSALGEYHVRVRLVRDGGAVESNECVFRVGGFETSALHVATGIAETRGEGEGALVDRGQLHTFEVREGSPEIAEADAGNVIHRVAVGKGADPAVPARNTPFFDEMVRWIVWLEGASVKALTSIDETPAAVTLPYEGASLVKPPLKTKNGPVEALVLARDKKALQLVRFDRPVPANADAARVGVGTLGWSAPLPAEARAIVAALGPALRGSERHVAFAANTPKGIDVFHVRYGDSGLSGAPVAVHIEQKPPPPKTELAEDAGAGFAYLPFSVDGGQPPRLLDGATPALHVDEKGGAWASFVAVAGARALWIEAHFPAGGAPADKPRVTELSPLGAALVDGAAAYISGASHEIVRREVVLLLQGQKLARWDGSKLVTLPGHGTPARPLVLVPGQDVTYLVHVEKTRGPHLEPL
jgi:hypothetical protein